MDDHYYQKDSESFSSLDIDIVKYEIYQENEMQLV